MNVSKIPELLAPAGNMECLHAAVSGGADAVYLGMGDFNARRNAGNFTASTLREACDYAHLRGVSIYVTMNTEVLPGELAAALSCAYDAYTAGADAFIVQDVGLAREIARAIPGAPLHASTQMNLHNAAGMETAARLGCTRVTLARELSLDEIAELSDIAGSLGMEIECFAHGALCICYSGQCLMSSMIGGRSANRGLCAQACRLPYALHREGDERPLPADGDHLLSPRDLCSIGILERLAACDVASLKIEGRMKSPDYVHAVTSVYRKSLDELAHDHSNTDEETLKRRTERLAEAFSRGFTTAYLEGKRGNEIMSYGRPNNRGVFIGRVARVQDGMAEIALEADLHEGDMLEIWTNRGHFTALVPPITGMCGKTANIPISQRASRGDRVFRVRNAQAAFADDPFEPRVRVSGQARIHVGEPAHIRFETADGSIGEAWGDPVEAARTKALEEADVRTHVDRLGQTPFSLESLSIDLDAHAGMGFSRLHHLRAQALEDLSRQILKPYKARMREKPPATSVHQQDSAHVREQLTTRAMRKGGSPHGSACTVAAWATNPDCARAAKRAGASDVFVPLLNFRRGQAQICGVVQESAGQAGYPKQCLMAIPPVDHDPVRGTREETLPFDPWNYIRPGKTVLADSLAGAIRALDMGALVDLGPHVPLMNAAALEFVAELGVKRVWLSPELTLGQIANLAESAPPELELGIFVAGAQELMICEHCLLMSQGACAENCEECPRRRIAHKLIDRKGFEFPVVTDMLGRSHLYNGIELDAVAVIPDLMDVGLRSFLVDTTLMDKRSAEAATQRVARAIEQANGGLAVTQRRPGTTTGHLFRGVS